MTDRVARLDLDPIKERLRVQFWELSDWQTREDVSGLIAEVERLRSVLLQQNLEGLRDLATTWHERSKYLYSLPATGILGSQRQDALRLSACADELDAALLLCEAQGRRHEEQETKEKIDMRYESPVTPPSGRATASTD